MAWLALFSSDLCQRLIDLDDVMKASDKTWRKYNELNEDAYRLPKHMSAESTFKEWDDKLALALTLAKVYLCSEKETSVETDPCKLLGIDALQPDDESRGELGLENLKALLANRTKPFKLELDLPVSTNESTLSTKLQTAQKRLARMAAAQSTERIAELDSRLAQEVHDRLDSEADSDWEKPKRKATSQLQAAPSTVKRSRVDTGAASSAIHSGTSQVDPNDELKRPASSEMTDEPIERRSSVAQAPEQLEHPGRADDRDRYDVVLSDDDPDISFAAWEMFPHPLPVSSSSQVSPADE